MTVMVMVMVIMMVSRCSSVATRNHDTTLDPVRCVAYTSHSSCCYVARCPVRTPLLPHHYRTTTGEVYLKGIHSSLSPVHTRSAA